MDAMNEHEQAHGRFTPDEAAELIRRATAITHHDADRLSYEQVVEIANEIGITQERIEQALEEAQLEATREATDASLRASQRSVAYRCLEILCLKPIQRGSGSRTR